MQTLIWALAIFILLISFVIMPYLQYRRNKKENESFLQFQEELKEGDYIILSSGIFGKIVKMNEDRYEVSISKDVEISVLPQAIVGRDLKKANDEEK